MIENELWITEEFILEHIGKITENKAAGTDDLGSTLIRKLAGELALPLMMIFRKSMQIGVVPEQWKEANVTAIFKRKGHKSDPGNYQPDSLMSQIGKIFERLIRDRIVRFLEENNKLRDSQHGFRAERSCLTNLLELIWWWTMWIRECRWMQCIWTSRKLLIRCHMRSWC